MNGSRKCQNYNLRLERQAHRWVVPIAVDPGEGAGSRRAHTHKYFFHSDVTSENEARTKSGRPMSSQNGKIAAQYK